MVVEVATEAETGAGIITEMGLGLTDITMVETDRGLTKREPQHKAFYVTKNYGLRDFIMLLWRDT